MGKNKDEFAEFAAEQKQLSGDRSKLFTAAFAYAVLPAILFALVFELRHPLHLVLFAVVTAASGYLMGTAHFEVFKANHAYLTASHRGASGKTKARDLSAAARNFALFNNNLIFAVCFVFLAFYAFAKFNPAYAYALSVLIASGAAWKLSQKGSSSTSKVSTD